MARKFSLAEAELLDFISKNETAKAAKKKLIICHIQTGKIEKALKIFIELLKEDISFIINTNPDKDDCPCPELVTKIENENNKAYSISELYTVLGMLWLYCDINKSVRNFELAQIHLPKNEDISYALQKIKEHKINGMNLGVSPEPCVPP
jgi:hypothetical protein